MLNKQEISQCNASDEILKKYDEISFSIHTDRVFKKIDSNYTIKAVYSDKFYHTYITTSCIIKFEKWDNVVTIMDHNNKHAQEVYLVNKFLGKELI